MKRLVVEPATCDKFILDSEYNLQRVQNAVKKNLGVSLPFMADIAHHMITPHNNSTRSLLLLQSASLFKKPDQAIVDIGSTLEFLHTASALHRHIKEPENARRHQRHVQKLWGSEASVLLGDYLLSISFQILTRVGNLDVLECVSLATQNISRGQVLEISAPIFSATPKHWRRVTRDKFAGLFGAGAQSAAYWGDASQTTVSTLFDFGEHLGMAVKLKTDLESLNNEKRFSQKLNDEELWSPLCFLIHECLPESGRREMSEKLENGFDVEPMIKELSFLFEKYKIDEMIQTEAKQELKQAGECLVNLEMDASPLQPLTSYSMI